MIVIFIGPPGSGKGTQADLIGKKIGLPVVSTGDVLRAKAQSQDPDGLALKLILESGKLAPTDMVNKFVLEDVNSYNNGCILDGYPRNLAQAEFLSGSIKQPLKVLYFEIDNDILLKRITGRFSCSECGKIYNKFFSPTKIDNECDVCGEKNFTHRSDDNEVTISNRLETYKQETMPVIDYYKKSGALAVVDATNAIEKITEELLSILKSD